MSKRKKQSPADQPASSLDDDASELTGFEPIPEGEGEAGDDRGREQTQVSPAATLEPDEEAPTQESPAPGEDDEPTQEVATRESPALVDEVETIEMSIDAEAGGLSAADLSPADAATDDESHDDWGEPTRVAGADQLAELAAQSAVEPGMGDNGEPLEVESQARLESIIESLLFAADRPLNLSDLKRLVVERDAKKLIAALGALQLRHQHMGIQLASAGGGWQFRTNPQNASWVAKMVAGRPARLSRAMLETLAIVAYRQPITRPEIDEIRGVDCGPVLKTLLDRTLIRMIGKKEEVGRPILYGTTPDFLRTFSLKDLTELPTLRQFHELGVAEQAKVDAEIPATVKGAAGQTPADAASPAAGPPRAMPAPTKLPEHDPEEEDALLAELDDATASATRATRSPDHPPADHPPADHPPADHPPPVPEVPEASE